MTREQQPVEDAFLERLVEIDDRLEKGEAVHDSMEGSTTDAQLDQRLNRGLACLKLLDGVRKRQSDTPTSRLTIASDIAFTQVKYKLPCRFGKFELIKELGRGGFGVVFLARDRLLDCEVALKMPHAHVLTNDQLRERFRREARVAAGLQHPHIVPVHEAGDVGPVSYIVYSYCAGITLGDWLRAQKDQVPALLAAEWIANLAEAVAYAHSKGVLHRDLKPSNILLHATQTKESAILATRTAVNQFIPKITDFGLAKLEREKQQTATGAILGTPSYMAPEQASGKGAITPAVDIHALGVLLYEMLAGHPPYRGESDYDTLQLVSKQEPLPIRKVRPKLSRDLETICLKCLQKDPQLRYRDAAELAADLRRFLKHEPIKARPLSVVERSWRQCRRHPVVTGLAVALFLALIGGITGIVWQYYHRGLQADATQAWLSKYQDLLRREVESAVEMWKDSRTEKQGRERLLSLLQNYDALLLDSQSEPKLQQEAARLAVQAGSIHHTLGEYQKSIARLQQSVDLFKQAHARVSVTPSMALEEANAMSRLAFAYRTLKKWDHSELIYRQVIQNIGKVLQRDQDNVEALVFIANTLTYNCVNIYQQNRFDEAEKDLIAAQHYAEQAIELKPDDVKARTTYAFVLDDYGWHCLQAKRREEGYQLLTKSQGIRAELHEQNPKSSSLREALAKSYWRIGVYHARNKDWNEAVEQYSISMRMNDQSMIDFPYTPFFAHNAAADRVTIYDVLEIQKNYQEAEKVLREAMGIRKKCMQDFPNYEVNKVDYAALHFRFSSLLRYINNLEEAQQVYQDGLELCEKIAQEQPEHIRTQELLAGRLQTLAERYETERDSKKAEDAYRRLLKAREQLVERFPQVIVYQRDLDNSYVKLASTHRKARQWKDASDLMARSIPLRRQIISHHDADWKDRHLLALRYLAWGRDLHELAQDEQAGEKYQQCLQVFAQLEKDNIKSLALTEDHGNALMQYGYLIWDQNKKLAHEMFMKALPLREALFFSSSSAPHRNLLARCNYVLYLSHWQVNYDIFRSAKHYCISCLVDPVHCKPPIAPATIFQAIRYYNTWRTILSVIPAKSTAKPGK